MPKLSVAIIARNEERNLARALASVSAVADEVIVTDTGSTDQTPQIASRFGARLARFDWIDDFSAAHNYCNGLATGDWIFMLDADEELVAESRDELVGCMRQNCVLAYAVLRQDLIDEARPDEYSEMWQTRLFRNRPDVRFQGRFHHHFLPPLAELAARDGLELRESGIRLRHHGYLARLKPQKDQRAVRLLELELRDRPGQFYYLVELGLTQLSLGDSTGHDRLAEAAAMVAGDDPQVAAAPSQLAMLLEYVLSNPRLQAGFPLAPAEARRMAMDRFPAAIPLLWQIAAEHNRRQRFTECASVLEKILALGCSHAYQRLASFDPAIMGDDARLNLGVCYVRMGQLQKAKRCFRRLVDSPTRGKEARDNLKALEHRGRR